VRDAANAFQAKLADEGQASGVQARQKKRASIGHRSHQARHGGPHRGLSSAKRDLTVCINGVRISRIGKGGLEDDATEEFFAGPACLLSPMEPEDRRTHNPVRSDGPGPWSADSGFANLIPSASYQWAFATS